MVKPEAVKEVEAGLADAVTSTWEKLKAGQEPITEEDLELIINAAREDRKRWMTKKAAKGETE